MKELILALALIACLNTSAKSDNEAFEELRDTVGRVKSLDKAKSGPNDIDYDCVHCITDLELGDAVVLNQQEVSMERVLFEKGTRDNDFVIIRTKNTPKKVTIKFKEKYRVCQKMISHRNPFSGQIGFSCLHSKVEFREESLELDFSERELSGASEAITVRLVKLNSRNKGFINASFKDQSGSGISSEKGGKFLFFGTKYILK